MDKHRPENTETQKLLARGIRPTAMRILVLRYLITLERTTSLADLETHFAHSEKSTLFRTLKTFEAKGLIHKIDDGTGIVKYGLCAEACQCRTEEQHFHFHCQKCKQTYCLKTIQIPELGLPPKFIVRKANLVLEGLCPTCNF